MRSHYLTTLLAALGIASLSQVYAQGIIGQPPAPGDHWPRIQAPAGNPFEEDPVNPFQPLAGSLTERRVRIGKLLFWDEQVSSDNTMACGTCHKPAFGGTDSRLTVPAPNGKLGALGMVPQDSAGQYRGDAGLQQGRRVTGLNPPSMISSGYFSRLFWDMRAGPEFRNESGDIIPGFEDFSALEALSIEPPISDIEMAHDNLTWGSGELQAKLGPARPLRLATPDTIPGDLASTLADEPTYTQLFNEAFPGEESGVTRERFAMAVAAYQRTLVPNMAPIDVKGLNHVDLEDAREGFVLMRTGGCFGCHSASFDPQINDAGHFVNPLDNILSDGDQHVVPAPPPSGNGFVKTPSLRNSALKLNLYHNGSLHSIEDAIAFLNSEHDTIPNVAFPVQLGEVQKGQVLAFFQALVDPRVAVESFPFDRPELYGDRVPFDSNLYGEGTPPPSGELIPRLVANSPILDGLTSNQLGLFDGPPGGVGVLHVSLAPANGPLAWIDTLEPNYVGHGFTSIDGDGVATFATVDPPVGLIGSKLFVQWAAISPENEFSLSRAAEMIVQ